MEELCDVFAWECQTFTLNRSLPIPGSDKNQQGLSCSSLRWATEERGEEAGGGPPTAPMRLTRSLRAENREVNNLKSFGFPFRPRFVSRHEFFGSVSPAIKSGIVTISGLGKELPVFKAAQEGQIVTVSTGKVKTLANLANPHSVSQYNRYPRSQDLT